MATARTLGTIMCELEPYIVGDCAALMCICELAAYSVGDGAELMPAEAYMNLAGP
jgi:hypothetical protein